VKGVQDEEVPIQWGASGGSFYVWDRTFPRMLAERRPAGYRYAPLERLRKPSLQELSQLRSGLELRNRVEFLEG
jgi:hypothetical protein